MALHPQARKAIEQYAAADSLPVSDPRFDIAAERAADRAAALAEDRLPLAHVRDVDAGGVPARLYLPETYDAVVVHAHGGGFVLNDVEVHDAAVRRFADLAGVAVLSVDYRRPPEHRFPAAPDDVVAALDWVGTQPELADLPCFAHGDSAGGNLALVAALRRPGALAGLVLIYPFLDPSASFDSYRSAADGFDPADAAWYWDQYASTRADLEHPDLAPLRSTQLHTLPPTLVLTAEHDPLRDEGEHLVHLLAEAGVEVVGTRYLGQIHGFWRHTGTYDAAEPSMWQVAGWLRMQVRRRP
ncbi:alpha/beta hydrolase [Nocardioides sp. zg-536]|uniref:Alpha/beta hydrolase n=1 Tax=Nocardioides faecalis TaxID=2803858 RepID=A0A938Y7N8_9ACTN|nr:alpha/beta hydrolase [Nocardioides faecalis]MBM9460717.1 alpha/beta hydrolase [Nocardioides faecalis]MBS4752656.1 alpha/beta hydrolase [Nocardioides faecalis]QVI57920.1 alpha/beta hydrolase [Nocardioides faecalis]